MAHLRTAHERKRRASAEPLESLRAGLSSRFSAELIDHVVNGLAEVGKVVVEGPGIRLAGHEPGLSEEEERALRDLEQVLLAADLAPPSPAELSPLIGVGRDVLNDLLRLLVERGQVVRVTPENVRGPAGGSTRARLDTDHGQRRRRRTRRVPRGPGPDPEAPDPTAGAHGPGRGDPQDPRGEGPERSRLGPCVSRRSRETCRSRRTPQCVRCGRLPTTRPWEWRRSSRSRFRSGRAQPPGPAWL